MPTLEQDNLKQTDTTDSDLLDELKNEIEKDLGEDDQVLVELSNVDHLQKIIGAGEFSRDDLEHLLTRSEKLADTVAFFAEENENLRQFVKIKDEKIMSSIELIASQRDWVHSLLDDSVQLRSELEEVEATKALELEVLNERINSFVNEREELEESKKALQDEKQEFLYTIEDKDREIRKANGSIKKNQTQVIALQEQVISLEKQRSKDKYLIRLVAIFALFTSGMLVLSVFGANQRGQGKMDTNAKNLVEIVNENKDLLGEGETQFVTNLEESIVEEIASDDSSVSADEILDDKIADEILASLKSNDVVGQDNASGVIDADSNVIGRDVVVKDVSSKIPKFTTYVVKPNDNLTKISKKFYGSGKYADDIKRDNKLGRTLQIGTKIKIAERIEEGE